MNYLLDTNHWSYLQRSLAPVVARVRSLPDDATIYMPVIALVHDLTVVSNDAHFRHVAGLRVEDWTAG